MGEAGCCDVVQNVVAANRSSHLAVLVPGCAADDCDPVLHTSSVWIMGGVAVSPDGASNPPVLLNDSWAFTPCVRAVDCRLPVDPL